MLLAKMLPHRFVMSYWMHQQKLKMTQSDSTFRRCTLCPRRCAVNRERDGAPAENGGVRVARAALHFWEEPCLSGSAGSGASFSPAADCAVYIAENYGIAHQNHGKEIKCFFLS